MDNSEKYANTITIIFNNLGIVNENKFQIWGSLIAYILSKTYSFNKSGLCLTAGILNYRLPESITTI